MWTMGTRTPSQTVGPGSCHLHGCARAIGNPPEALTHLDLTTLNTAYSETPRPDPNQKRTPSSVHRRATADSSLSKGAIAGIAVGTVVALILTASLAYFLYRRRIRDGSERTSVRSWKGPRRTTSSLDFKCRTRVTPMASRVDFRRLHMADARVIGNEKRLSGVQPGDALGSNPVLGRTLEESAAAASPHADTESSWNGQTLCSANQSPPCAGSIKWESPAVPSPRTPAPAYSPHRTSPYTLPSATPSSTRSAAPLLPAKTVYTPPKYGSVSPPSSYRSAGSGYGALCPPEEIWEGPTRALRTQRGTWDLRSLEEGRGGSVTPRAIAEVGGGSAWGYARAAVPRSGEHQDV